MPETVSHSANLRIKYSPAKILTTSHAVSGLSFSPDGRMLAIVLQKTVIEVWMLPIDKNESYVRLCQLEPANKVHINVMSWYLLGLVCGYSNGQIGLIHLREQSSSNDILGETLTQDALTDGIACLALSKSADRLAVSCSKVLAIMQRAHSELDPCYRFLCELKLPNRGLKALRGPTAIHWKDETTLVAMYTEGLVIWNINTNTYRGPNAVDIPSSGGVLSPDGENYVAENKKGGFDVYNLSLGGKIKEFTIPGIRGSHPEVSATLTSSAKFMHGGSFFVAGGLGKANIWETASGQWVQKIILAETAGENQPIRYITSSGIKVRRGGVTMIKHLRIATSDGGPSVVISEGTCRGKLDVVVSSSSWAWLGLIPIALLSAIALAFWVKHSVAW